jgi:hypothetical protein
MAKCLGTRANVASMGRWHHFGEDPRAENRHRQPTPIRQKFDSRQFSNDQVEEVINWL